MLLYEEHNNPIIFPGSSGAPQERVLMFPSHVTSALLGVIPSCPMKLEHSRCRAIKKKVCTRVPIHVFTASQQTVAEFPCDYHSALNAFLPEDSTKNTAFQNVFRPGSFLRALWKEIVFIASQLSLLLRFNIAGSACFHGDAWLFQLCQEKLASSNPWL